MTEPERLPRSRRREAGQALVLAALSIVVLLGMAAVAVDAGRFLTQRRFVQNAADAAALAAADVVVAQWGSTTVGTARQAARDVLAIDLAGSPVGAPLFSAADPPVFNGAAIAADLADGIVLADSTGAPLPDSASLDGVADVRVALVSRVDFTFGRVVGITTGSVNARARVGFMGNLMPIAVRRYYNPPGPNAPAANPCPEPPDHAAFTDLAATQATSCTGQVDTGSVIGYDVRSAPSLTAPGSTVPLVGDGATAANNSNFRGFVALDVRDFADAYSRLYYNGASATMNQNSLKNLETGWVDPAPPGVPGYPGPLFPPVATPPDPNDQVGVMDGNSAGLVVDAINTRFHIGDRILCALYDGTVMSIPDFTMNTPASISLTAGAAPTNAGTFKISRNQAFSGQVTLSTVAAPSWFTADYTPNPVTPTLGSGTAVSLTNAGAAAGTPAQIATAWIKGQAGSPYLTAHLRPVAINVGGVDRDFVLATSPDQAAANWGDFLTYTISVSAKTSSYFPGPITLSLDSSSAVHPALPAGSYWFNGVQGTTSVALNLSGGSASATLTINTGMLGADATYPFVVLASGTNSAGQAISHAAVAKVLASASADDSNYIDIIGFAVYRITAIDSNTVTGQAVSPVAATADDPSLRSALKPRLIPW